MNMTSRAIPHPALTLGLAGLVPFVSTALGLIFASGTTVGRGLSTDFLVQALGAYGAVILSFLGGVRWGKLLDDPVSSRDWIALSLSVVPSLVAWTALLLDVFGMLVLLLIGFTAQYALDIRAAKHGRLPPWFGSLRGILTAGVLISLLAAMIALK